MGHAFGTFYKCPADVTQEREVKRIGWGNMKDKKEKKRGMKWKRKRKLPIRRRMNPIWYEIQKAHEESRANGFFFSSRGDKWENISSHNPEAKDFVRYRRGVVHQTRPYLKKIHGSNARRGRITE